jgi:hypothetical protein
MTEFGTAAYRGAGDRGARCLEIFDAEGVKILDNRHGDTYPDMPWEPKAAFTALAEYYRG